MAPRYLVVLPSEGEITVDPLGDLPLPRFHEAL